jgi:hypothetical protein
MRPHRQPLKVFLTLDTELCPINAEWRETRLEEKARFCICGETPSGSFGLPYQLDVLSQRRPRAIFFVESLFSTVIAQAALGAIKEKYVRPPDSGGPDCGTFGPLGGNS